MSGSFLDGLNPQQLQAVKHDPSHPLQILAGPGSGKTAVLTARIAYLILHRSHAANSICAVTFTNKAANEMRERLTKLVGKQITSDIRLGTFHALCAQFLRRHGKLLGLGENFTVCDAEESKKLIKGLLKKSKADLDSTEVNLTEGTVLNMISKAKAKGKSPAIMLKEVEAARKIGEFQEGELPLQLREIIAEIYDIYEKYLRKSNCLDFDDLLVFGVRLFREHPKTASWCKHILVDEFQDTNTIQYELMCMIAARAKCLSIVGDPDQSIYGWRSAEVENLAKMQREFKPVKQIFLERNYRSTASILAFSLAVVSQDTERINKSLHTSHPSGSKPMLKTFDSEDAEAAFIAQEIKRTSAYMGGSFKWSDYVILLRFNALSRLIESALQKEGIPSRVLGGHKFFERLEVKDLLAYLQLVDNPNYDPAFIRASNVPPRGIGDKTLKELAKRAEDAKISQLELAERISDGKVPDTKPSVKKKIAPFIKITRTLRTLANEGTAPQLLISKLLDLIDYQEHLKRTQPDWSTRWENVQELITFATDVHGSYLGPEDEDRVKSEEESDTEVSPVSTPLRTFLQASMLSSEGDGEQKESKEKVTISTCHSAKGLEWPVVFIPAAENGVFPFSRTESVPEERRLLYVACTRSQTLLYITSSSMRKHGGDKREKQVSPFILAIVEKQQDLFTSNPPIFDQDIRKAICKVLNRSLPDEADLSARVEEYQRNTRYHALPMEPAWVYACHSGPEQCDNPFPSVGINYGPASDRLKRIRAEGGDRGFQSEHSDNIPLGFVRVRKEGSTSAWNQTPVAPNPEKPSSSAFRSQNHPNAAAGPSSASVKSSARATGTKDLSTGQPQVIPGNQAPPFSKLKIKEDLRDRTRAQAPAYHQSKLGFTRHKGKGRANSIEIIEFSSENNVELPPHSSAPHSVLLRGSQSLAVNIAGILPNVTSPPIPLSPTKAPPKVNGTHLMDNTSMPISRTAECPSIADKAGTPGVSSATSTIGRKRLGMGRVTGLYSNKRFKLMKPT